MFLRCEARAHFQLHATQEHSASSAYIGHVPVSVSQQGRLLETCEMQSIDKAHEVTEQEVKMAGAGADSAFRNSGLQYAA